MNINEQSYQKKVLLDISKDDFKTILEQPSENEVVRFIDKYEDPDKFIKFSQDKQILNVEILQVQKGDNQANFICIIKEQIQLDNVLSTTIYKLNKNSYLVKEINKIHCLRVTINRIKLERAYKHLEIGTFFCIDNNKFVVQDSQGLKIFHSKTFKIIKNILAQDILLLGSLSQRSQVFIKKGHDLFSLNVCNMKMKKLSTCAVRILFLNKKYLLQIEQSYEESYISISNIKQIHKNEQQNQQSEFSLSLQDTPQTGNSEEIQPINVIEKCLQNIRSFSKCIVFSHKYPHQDEGEKIQAQDYLLIMAENIQMRKQQCLFFKIVQNNLIECPTYYFNEAYPSFVQCLSFHENDIYFFIQFEVSNKLFLVNKLFPK